MSVETAPNPAQASIEMSPFEDSLNQSIAPITGDANERTSVRFLDAVADRVASLADNLAGRRTASEFAADKVEAGKKIAENVGVTVVAHAIVAGSTLKNNVTSNYGELRASGQENVSRFKGFLQRRAEASRARKANLVAKVKQRSTQGANAVRKGYEVSNDRFNQSIRVGHEALKYAALVPVAVGIVGAEAGARATVRGAQKVGEGYNATKAATGNTINRTQANAAEKKLAVHGFRARRAANKSQKTMFKEANRMNSEFDARKRAAAARNKVKTA